MILVPRASERRKTRATLVVALLATLVSHLLLIALLLFVSHLKLDTPSGFAKKPVSHPFTLRPMSAADWQKNRGQPQEASAKDSKKLAAQDRPEKEKAKPLEKPDGQIVATPEGNGQVDPNAKYVSESNNVTKKETRAKEQTAFYKNALSQRSSPKPIEGEGHDPVEVVVEAGNLGKGSDDRPLKEASTKRAFEVPDVKARSEVAFKDVNREGPGAPVANRSEEAAIKGNSDKLNIQLGQEPGAAESGSDGRAGLPGLRTLIPSFAVLDKLSGAAANDHLQDVEEGEGTYLSTREWKYAGFFNRVKQSVGQHWNPQSELRMRDPSFEIYGGRDRYTLVQVTLNEQGRLKDVYVEKSSGLDFLDLEAIRAFERAQPFPNPPPGLLASDQTVRFQFGFYLEMSGHGGLKLFRSTE